MRDTRAASKVLAVIHRSASEPDVGASEEPAHPLAAALKPSGIFAQFGVAREVTAGTAGVSWSLGRDNQRQPWSVYLEASVSRWQSRSGYASDHGVLTQVALYRKTGKRFSTAFNNFLELRYPHHFH
jgi:hypothetical protein